MKLFKRIFRLVLKIFLSLFLFSLLWIIVYKWVNPPVTFLMLQRKLEATSSPTTLQKRGEKDTKIYYEWVEYEEMSYYMPLAAIASEDQNFSTHHGFDLEAIEKALEHNKKHKRIRGASTISQQVAKNVFLWNGRSWFRKGLEVYFTFMIEVCWSKKRIVEMYVNIAEMGERTFGIGAASKRFFKTNPKNISMEQAALLATVLPNPRKFSALNPSNYIQKRKSWIMEQMTQLGGKEYLKEIE